MTTNLRRDALRRKWLGGTAMVVGAAAVLIGVTVLFGGAGLGIVGGSLLFVVGWVELDS